MNSETSSEQLEQNLTELNRWKRTVEGELESQFERIRSIAGRVDRAKRKDNPNSEPTLEPAGVPEADGDQEQSRLNALLAKRFHG